MQQFFYGSFLMWLPVVVSLLFWVYMVYTFMTQDALANKFRLKLLIGLAMVWQVFFAGLLTFLQYRLWLNNSFTKLFLVLPLNKDVPLFGAFRALTFLHTAAWGYFAYYALYHFWLNVLIGFLVAGLVLGFYKIWARLRPDSLSAEDGLSLVLGALIVLWPGDLVFILLTLLLAVVNLLVNRYVTARSRLLLPLMISLVVVIVLGRWFIARVGLDFLTA